jgi:hypothetical protein
LTAVDRRHSVSRMAKHEVGLDVNRLVTVGNVDVEIPVKADGKALGRLRISKGGVDWTPARKQKPYRMSWEQFSKLMQDGGKLRS